MINFLEVIDALRGEMSASALRRQDIGTEMTRLHLENDSCLSTENEIRSAIGALTRLAEKQATATTAAVVLKAVPYEASETPAEASVRLGIDPAIVAEIEAKFPERAEMPATEAAPPAAPIEAKPAPAKAATPLPSVNPPPSERMVWPDKKPAPAVAVEVPGSKAQQLADQIEKVIDVLTDVYPGGPTAKDLTRHFGAPDPRVRDAVQRLTKKGFASFRLGPDGLLRLVPAKAEKP